LKPQKRIYTPRFYHESVWVLTSFVPITYSYAVPIATRLL